MRWNEDRRAVAAAAERLAGVRVRHRRQTQWLRDAVQEHCGLFAIAGGAVAGFVLGRLPIRAWLKTGLAAVGTAVSIARTPLGPIALGAFMARRSAATDDAEAAPH